MAAPNPATPFTANIVAFFSGQDWMTDVVEGSVTFQGRANTMFTFVNFEDVPLTLDRPVVVTFGIPPCPQNNPIINLFMAPTW